MEYIVHGVAKSRTPLSDSQFRAVLDMHTDMQIKGRQFTLAWKHSFTLSIHLLRTCHVRGLGSVPGLERSPGEGKGYPLQYFDLETSKERGAW